MTMKAMRKKRRRRKGRGVRERGLTVYE